MKKFLPVLIFCILMHVTSNAQTVIYDNGPLVNFPGGGFGGADVSHLHDGMNSLGSNHSFGQGYRVADDIVIPAGESWNIDSLVFYSYQTQATNNTVSTMLDINVRIWDGIPGDPLSTVVFGDDFTNLMITSEWSGIYRTADFGSANCPPTTCTQRAVMRNANTIGASLSAGTYWIDWQSNGSLTSGPWAPQINLGIGVTTSGNGLQYVPTTQLWQPAVDTVPANGVNEPQGFPFLVVGSVVTGISTTNANSYVTVSPNPMNDLAVINVSLPSQKNNDINFYLYDMLGNKVHTISHMNTAKFDFERGTLPDGVYFYEVKNGNKLLKMGKLVLQ